MDTFSEFMNYLDKNKDSIRRDLKLDETSEMYKFYRSLFESNYHKFEPSDPGKIDVAATDSSEFLRMLYNGKNIILIRAYTLYQNKTTSDFVADIVAVDPVDQRNFTILLMEHSEHKSILKFMEENSPEYIFIDGSLKGRLSHRIDQLPIEGYENFMYEYVKTLKEVIKRALDKNITLIFMAKSSYTDCFKKYLLGTARKDPETLKIIEKESGIYRNDHYLIKSFAREKGYTQPVMYRKNIEGTDISYVSLDVLPDPEDLPLKVQIISRDFLREVLDARAYNMDEKIINLIFYGYTGYKVYNLWLVDVDKKVKFRSVEMERIYMRALERKLGITFYETRGERRARIRA
ncbi:DNA double-strand break repair nuclease NurA [Ferroplasma sp.]|uniref:DNA double-strand break repair nuclease NurA n=1 Tax=Ferroplasma sp. TaxID=2591003 RepID=UPI002626F426|nr:DNA double-strand break repair nuclease NurA [Ferroplasma sp.]